MSDSFASPWTVAQQVPLSMGFPRQEYWSRLPFPFLRDLPNPGIEPSFPALAADFFTAEPPGKHHPPNFFFNWAELQIFKFSGLFENDDLCHYQIKNSD